jgi:two-component system NtrC family response regulator
MTAAQTAPAAEDESAPRILLVEDDIGLQKQMRWALAPYQVTTAASRTEALAQFDTESEFDVVLLDLGLPPDANGATEGLKALKDILDRSLDTKVIIVSGNVDRVNAVKAIASGAFDFVTKPVDPDVLKIVIDRAFRMHALERENKNLRDAVVKNTDGLVFSSRAMDQVAQIAQRVAPMDVSVMLIGDTGTGKEVIARHIHKLSLRHANPFIAINCASIPENLLESELFGHERGAFTGAIKRTLGKFEMANNGTLLLDEIGDMPMALQAKLLRFLQDRRLERVGGRESITVNVRLITATNQKLEKLIAEGRFREDLYYRINEVRIDLPPLREREGDIAVISQYFLDRFSNMYSKPVAGFSQDALAAMNSYTWPGNVRELENRMKRAVVMSAGKRITAEDLDLSKFSGSARDFDLRKEVRRLEKRMVTDALAVTDGNISKAAKLLGISRPHLYDLMTENDSVG